LKASFSTRVSARYSEVFTRLQANRESCAEAHAKAVMRDEALAMHYKGGFDGCSWTVGLKDSPSIQAVLAHAQRSLLSKKTPGKLIAEKAKELGDLMMHFKTMREQHDYPLQPGAEPSWYKECCAMASQCHATVLEACCLSFIQQHHTNPIKLKNLVHKQIKTAQANNCQPFVHSVIWQAMLDIQTLSFHLPADFEFEASL
jgi:hypothetical protein